MTQSKKSVGLRLSEKTIKDLKSLADTHRVGQNDIVSILIQLVTVYGEASKEKIEEWLGVVAL